MESIQRKRETCFMLFSIGANPESRAEDAPTSPLGYSV